MAPVFEAVISYQTHSKMVFKDDGVPSWVKIVEVCCSALARAHARIEPTKYSTTTNPTNPTNPARTPMTDLVAQVGPRDGLQNEKQMVPTDVKIELVNRLAETGMYTSKHTNACHMDKADQIDRLTDH